jgi:membrane-associated phospholipid phosphatase
MKRAFAPTRIFVVIGALSGGAVPPAALSGQTPPELDYTAPQTADWPEAYSRLLLVGGLILVDQTSRNLGHSLLGRGDRSWAAVGNWYGGRSATPYIVAGTLGLAALSEGSRGMARGAAILAGTYAGVMAAQVPKFVFGRVRPRDGSDPWLVDPFSAHESFPSGHATFAFAFASAVDEATSGWIPAVGAYGLATVTALARVRSDAHWFSDVVAGALIGTWVGGAVTARTLEGFGLRDEAPVITRPRTGPEGLDSGVVSPRSRVQPVLTTGYIGLQWRF